MNPLEKELSSIDENKPFEVKVIDIESACKVIKLCMATYKCFKVEIFNAHVNLVQRVYYFSLRLKGS